MQAHIMQGIHPNMTKDYSLEESLQSVHLQVTLNVYFPKWGFTYIFPLKLLKLNIIFFQPL